MTSNNTQSTDILFQYDGTVANSVSDTTTPIATTFADSRADFCVLPPAHLFLSKDADKTNVSVGDTLQYTISYGNTGQTNATNVILTDVLPAGVACNSYSLNGGPVQACPVPLSFSLGALAGGTSGILVISGTVAPGASGTLINSASISSDQTVPVADTAVTTIAGGGAGSPSLSISIAIDKTVAGPGETVTYTVTVINTGTAQANNVTITDILPVAPYYSYGSCSTATGTCGEGGGTLTWVAGSLPQGDAATMTFTMTAGSAGIPAGITQIDDSASVSATGVLPVTSNTVTVGLNGNPALVITKSATPDSGLTPGATVTWTIVISNTGSAAASDVTITDPVPGNMTYKAGQPRCVERDGEL
ncbi:MAG: DUF11 domain-containing protein [Desulfobacterales bacterium]|nr:DUF11 domain-containing protein [Desulfobacterales bacterium]